jgi:putative peptidoglycan lipid II flippase
MQEQPPHRPSDSFFSSPFPPLPDSLPPTLRRLRGDPSQSMIISSGIEALPYDIDELSMLPEAETAAIPEPAQPSAQIRALRRNQLAIATLIITGSFFFSRILGLLRISTFAYEFGLTPDADAFNLAFTLPNAVFNLVAGGALGSAFIPVFTEYIIRRQDRKTAWYITSAAFNLATLFLVLLAALAFIFMPELTRLYDSNDILNHPQQASNVILLSRVMLIQPIFLGLSVISTAVLQARQLFMLPALGQLLYNIGQIAGIVLSIIDSRTHILGGHLGIMGPVYGVVAGAAAQFLIQIPGLISGKMRYTLTFNFMHPGVIQIAKSMVPRLANSFMLYIGSSFVILSLLTSLSRPGIVAGYQNAFQIIQLPVGIFGMALSQAAFPSLATFVVTKDWERMRGTVLSALRIILYLSIPTTLGLMILAEPVTRVILNQGQYGEKEIHTTVLLLIFFSIGIPALAAIEILSRSFYALQDAKTAVTVGITELFFMIALSIILIAPMQANGIALAQSIGITGEASVLLLLLRRRIGPFSLRPLVNFIFGTLAASLIAVLATQLIYTLLEVGFQGVIFTSGDASGITAKLVLLVQLSISGGCGALVYYLAARFLGIEDTVPIDRVFSRIGRRMKKRK